MHLTTSILTKIDVVRCITISVLVATYNIIFDQNRCCNAPYNIDSSKTDVVLHFFKNILFVLLINPNLQIENKIKPDSIKYYIQIIIE